MRDDWVTDALLVVIAFATVALIILLANTDRIIGS